MGLEAEQLLIAGNELFSKSKFDEALSKYKEALESNPDYIEAIHNFGLTLARQNKHEDAIKEFLKVLEINPDYISAHINLGISYGETGNIEKAIEHFDAALRIDPQNVEIYNYYGSALLNSRMYDDAIDKYSKAFELKPDYVYPIYNWALALDRGKKYMEASAKYKMAISVDPSYLPSYQNLAKIYVEEKKYKKAAKIYEEIMEKFPDSITAHIDYGRTLANLSRFDEAMAEYFKALKIDPFIGFYPDYMAEVILKLKTRRNILSEIQQEIDKKPDADTYNKLGNLYFYLGMYDEAIEKYKKVISIKSDYIYAHHNWGLALNKLEKYIEAVAHFKDALNIDQGYLESIRSLGDAYYHSGSYNEAAEQYKELLRLDKNKNDIYADLAVSLIKSGDSITGLANFYKALEKSPREALVNTELINFITTHINREQIFSEIQEIVDKEDKADVYNDWGNIYYSLCRYEEAIKQYNLSVLKDPDFVYGYHNLGLCYFNMKEYSSAVEQYKNAIKADRDYSSTYFNYAYLLDRVGDYRESRTYWEKAAEHYEKSTQAALENNSVDHFYYYGDIVHSILNDYKRAEEIYRQGLSLDPEYVPIMLNLTNLYLDMKENASGKNEKIAAARIKANLNMMEYIQKTDRLISKKLEQNKSYDNYLDAADLYLIKGEYEKAIDMLQKALNINKTTVRVYSKLGNVYFSTGEYKKAIKYIEQALDLDPDDLNLQGELADAYLAVERTDEAESIYKKILSAAPNHVESYRGLGKIYSDYGDKDDVDMFKEAVNNFNKAINIAQSEKSSKRLKKKEIAELYYSRGYARVKMYEAEKITRDENIIRQALEDFRNCYSCDPDNHRAKRAQEKIQKSINSKPVRWLSEKLGPAVIFTFSFICLLAAQFVFFVGKPVIGPSGITAYQPIESGYYVLLTFGSLIFMITGLYLPQVLKLKVGGIELEKSAIDQMKSTISLGITKGTVDQTKTNLSMRISSVI